MNKTNNPILNHFQNSKCENELFKKWDRDLNEQIKKLFQVVENEQPIKNDSNNTGKRKSRIEIDFNESK